MSDEVFRWVIAGAVVVACLAIVLQAFLLAAFYRVTSNTHKKIDPLMERVDPILESARRLLLENAPRVTELTTEAAAAAKKAREQMERLGQLLEDASERVRERLEQIDQSVDQAVQQMEQMSESVKGALLRPIREANGIVAGVKAAVSTYAQGGRRPSVDHATQDEEMFI